MQLTALFSSLYSSAYAVDSEIDGNIQSLEYGLWLKRLSSGNHLVGRDIISTSDGGYAVVGDYYDPNTGNSDMFIYKVDYRGFPQSSFGNSGFVKFGGYDGDYATAVEQTSDGGYLVAGQTLSAGNWDIMLARFSSTGTPVSQFGNNGYQILGTLGVDVVRDIAIDARNSTSTKYLIVGSTASSTGTTTYNVEKELIASPGPSGDDLLVIRTLSNGQMDTGFGGNGVVSVNAQGTDRANWIDLTPDGRYIIGGYTSGMGGSNDKGLIVKLNYNGTPYTGFGTNGVSVVNPLTNLSFNVVDGFSTSDGKTVLLGMYPVSTGNTDFLITRLLANGQIDNTFGTNGNVLVGTADYDNPYALIKNNDGSFVVVGRTGGQSYGDIYMMKFSANGSIDTKFGTNGFREINLDTDDFAVAAVKDANENVVFTGFSMLGTTTSVLSGKLDYRGNMSGCTACGDGTGNISSISGFSVLGGPSVGSIGITPKSASLFSASHSGNLMEICNGVEIPKPLYPINGQRASSTPVTVSWNKIIAPKYQITVKGPGVWWKSIPLNGNYNSYTLSNLKLWKNQTYTWKVRACWAWSSTDCTQASPWSYEESFVYNPAVVE